MSETTQAPRGFLSKHRRLILTIGALSMVLALFIGGVVVGWRLSDSAEAARPMPEPSVVSVPARDAGPTEILMPDVRGLSDKAARQVIADAGIAPSAVTTSSRPWAGDVGQIIEQTPVFGTTDPPAVELVISKPARVPATEGLAATELSREISALGAQVTMLSKYKADATPGSVLSVEPAAGKLLPAEVTITQASSPSSYFLTSIEALQTDCRAEGVPVNGPTHDNSLVCEASEQQESVWLLSRVVDSITGEIGVPDTTDPETKAQVEIVVDDKVVVNESVTYGGDSIPVDLKTTGALRLTVRIRNTSTTLGSTQVALADIRLIGDESQLKSLRQQ